MRDGLQVDMTAEVAKHWHLASSFRDFPGPLGATALHAPPSMGPRSVCEKVGFFVSAKKQELK
jgi:hypothetical protein